MKSFQITRYLKRFLPVIVILCLLATYAINFNLNKANTYVASEVIHYNDPQTEQGKTPIGSAFDVNEIKSSAVMSKVVDRMKLTGTYSVDSLISRITITPLPDEDKVAQKEAKLEEGEEYIYEPSTFVVSFAAKNNEGEEFARTVLDEILDVYFSEYSQKYVNVAPAKNTIEEIQKGGYDYIEIMELIDSGIRETLETLYQRMNKSPYYRATQTGVSFGDLADEFNYIQQVKVSDLFSRIYKNQITKSKTVLVSDYTTRIDNNNILEQKEESIVEDTVEVIEAYVEKMRASGNTNITYEYILEDVYERNLTDGYFSGDQTVTYDELIYGWRDHNQTKEYAVIDSAYCQYVINTFSSCTGACVNKACTRNAKTCAELNNPEYAQTLAQIDEDINALVAELTELYDIIKETNEEYNEYLGASYISVLSTASVKPSVNVKLYTIIAFVFLIILCCGGSVILGRIGDIVEYVFYTDHLTEFNNRAYFDKYLKSMNRKMLDDGTVYCMVDIANLVAINTEYSRQVGDEIIVLFTGFLKEVFGKTKAEFIYNGNGSFIILAEGVDYITVEDIMRLFGLRLDERESNRDLRIEYKVGIAETFHENYSARKLLSEAIENKNTYVSDPGKKVVTE